MVNGWQVSKLPLNEEINSKHWDMPANGFNRIENLETSID